MFDADFVQFLLLQVLTIAAEIGGIISLSILKVKVSDIVDHSWIETNPKSRHLLQEQVCEDPSHS